MRFWDSSAIVPLLVVEAATARADHLFLTDPDMVVWWGTCVECTSAIARLRPERAFGQRDETVATGLLEEIRLRWHEMAPSDSLRAQALRVVRLHSLRAADALQLAAALEWAGSPASGTLVTFDDRLASAAAREGFRVEGPA